MPTTLNKNTISETQKFGITARIEWNYTNAEIIKRKGFGKELNLYMARLVAQKTEPYVPWGKPTANHRDGQLTHSVRCYATDDHGTVSWTVPYAAAQWNGPSTWKRYHMVHPLSTSHWEEVAMTYHKDEIVRKVDIKRRELSKP